MFLLVVPYKKNAQLTYVTLGTVVSSPRLASRASMRFDASASLMTSSWHGHGACGADLQDQRDGAVQNTSEKPYSFGAGCRNQILRRQSAFSAGRYHRGVIHSKWSWMVVEVPLNLAANVLLRRAFYGLEAPREKVAQDYQALCPGQESDADDQAGCRKVGF